MQIVSIQGDRVDIVCWRFYGNTNHVEQILDANPQLAFLPVILPIGTVITMPDIPQKNTVIDTVQLWD
ncbi:tail protein X [Agitococcus lubricus]|uniref:Phage tail protein X n=1 Tax=Agitococcus lubricus TaxID=1077255 RepID=A0A2T5J1H2_9GAMM|nr:tail protein X [Agitococcus lubricus]PTQ90290.1 phage tail protein X [Agitococcus lubricus]